MPPKPDPDLRSVLAVLAEKMGLSPAEFSASTVVIQDGRARVVPGEAEPRESVSIGSGDVVPLSSVLG